MTNNRRFAGYTPIARTMVMAAVLVTSISVSGIAQACLNIAAPAHTLALSVRTLQSDLMVAALSCNDRDRYNAVAVKYRAELQKQGVALNKYFKKMHGANATREINEYVTDLANYASVRHAESKKNFCGGANSAFSALLFQDNADIDKVALAYSMRVSPSLKEEIVLAATSSGCDIVSNGMVVAAGGETILK